MVTSPHCRALPLPNVSPHCQPDCHLGLRSRWHRIRPPWARTPSRRRPRKHAVTVVVSHGFIKSDSPRARAGLAGHGSCPAQAVPCMSACASSAEMPTCTACSTHPERTAQASRRHDVTRAPCSKHEVRLLYERRHRGGSTPCGAGSTGRGRCEVQTICESGFKTLRAGVAGPRAPRSSLQGQARSRLGAEPNKQPPCGSRTAGATKATGTDRGDEGVVRARGHGDALLACVPRVLCYATLVKGCLFAELCGCA